MVTFKNSKQLKTDARASLLGNMTTPVMAILFYTLATSVLSEMIANFNSGSLLISFLLSVVVFFVVNTCSNMLRIGLACIFLQLQLSKRAKVNDLFYAFRGNSDTAVTFSAFLALLELFCMLPFIITLSVLSPEQRRSYTVLILFLFLAGYAGITYIRIRYTLCSYLFLDFPELSAKQLIRGGDRMIRGHKGRLFRLYLSFLPLNLLTVLSMGIAGLWVSSYFHSAEAAFYRDLTLKLA